MSEIVNENINQVTSNFIHRESSGFLVMSSKDEKDTRERQQLEYAGYRPIRESEHLFEKIGVISFQKGHPDVYGINGFTNEAVIAILIDRILHLNDIVPCEENVKALARLQEAKELLEKRQQRIAGETINK